MACFVGRCRVTHAPPSPSAFAVPGYRSLREAIDRFATLSIVLPGYRSFAVPGYRSLCHAIGRCARLSVAVPGYRSRCQAIGRGAQSAVAMHAAMKRRRVSDSEEAAGDGELSDSGDFYGDVQLTRFGDFSCSEEEPPMRVSQDVLDTVTSMTDAMFDLSRATSVVRRLLMFPEGIKLCKNPDTVARLGRALKAAARGSSRLLPSFTLLVKATHPEKPSPERWAADMYHADAPQGGTDVVEGMRFLEELYQNHEDPNEGQNELAKPKAAELEPLHQVVVDTMKRMAAFAAMSTENIERLAGKFVALCMDDKKKLTELDASVFVAEVIYTKYRFARDPVQKDSKLMFFNGVVYKYARDDDVFVYARHAVVDLVDGALKNGPLLHEDLVGGLKLVRFHMANRSYRLIFDGALRELRSNDFYTTRGADTPEEFHDRLDVNPYIIACTNGIFDMKSRTFYPVGSVPVDMCSSYCTKYAFVGDEHGEPRPSDVDKVNELERELIDKLFPHPDVRRCAKLALGCTLVGGSGLVKKLFLAIGANGDNGKSALFNWGMKAVLGDYFYTLGVTNAYSTRDVAEGCTPSITQSKRRKMVVMNEGERDKPINAAFIKALCGGDDIVTRDLYCQPKSEEFLPKMWMLSNFPPKVSGDDIALMKRFYPLDFIATFKKEVAQDDHSGMVWRALPEAEIRSLYKKNAPHVLLLLIRWCKEFLDGQSTLPPVPLGSAAVALVREGTHENAVERLMTERYDKTPHAYGAPIRVGDFVDMRAIANDIKTARDVALKPAELKAILVRLGYRVQEINIRARGDVPAVHLANGVFVKEKEPEQTGGGDELQQPDGGGEVAAAV